MGVRARLSPIFQAGFGKGTALAEPGEGGGQRRGAGGGGRGQDGRGSAPRYLQLKTPTPIAVPTTLREEETPREAGSAKADPQTPEEERDPLSTVPFPSPPPQARVSPAAGAAAGTELRRLRSLSACPSSPRAV